MLANIAPGVAYAAAVQEKQPFCVRARFRSHAHMAGVTYYLVPPKKIDPDDLTNWVKVMGIALKERSKVEKITKMTILASADEPSPDIRSTNPKPKPPVRNRSSSVGPQKALKSNDATEIEDVAPLALKETKIQILKKQPPEKGGFTCLGHHPQGFYSIWISSTDSDRFSSKDGERHYNARGVSRPYKPDFKTQNYAVGGNQCWITHAWDPKPKDPAGFVGFLRKERKSSKRVVTETLTILTPTRINNASKTPRGVGQAQVMGGVSATEVPKDSSISPAIILLILTIPKVAKALKWGETTGAAEVGEHTLSN